MLGGGLDLFTLLTLSGCITRCSGRVRRNDLASTSTNIPPNSQPTVRDLFAVFQAKHQHNQQLLQRQEQQFCQDKEYGTARRSRDDARHHHVTPRSVSHSLPNGLVVLVSYDYASVMGFILCRACWALKFYPIFNGMMDGVKCCATPAMGVAGANDPRVKFHI